MSQSRLLLTSMLVSSALIMGACGNKDKGTSDKSASVEAIKGDNLDAKSFEKLLTVEKRETSEAEAQMALDKMGFDAANDGMVKWADSSAKDGVYTYSNLTATGSDGENIKIDELSLTGVHMVDDNPTFDRIDMKGINVTEDDQSASVASLSISDPSPKFGAAIVKFVENIDELDDLDIDLDLDEGEIPFGALLMNDVSVKGDDANVQLGSLGWGEDADSQKGVFLIEGLDLEAEAKRSGMPIKVSLASASGTGLDMKHFRKMGDAAKGAAKPGGFNPFAKTFESYAVEDFAINVDTLSITTDGMKGKAKTKGDITTITQKMDPIKLAFSGEAQDPQMARMQQTLSMAGFETIEMSGASTSKLDKKADSFEVTESYLKVKDAFDLNMSYGGTGLSAVETSMENSSNPDPDALLSAITLTNFDMALTDNSIIDKVLNIAAKQQGTTPATMKMQAKSGLMMLGLAAQNEAQGKALTDLSAALGKLLDEGGTLKIGLNPENPVALSSLKDTNPQQLDPAMLGFSVSHSK